MPGGARATGNPNGRPPTLTQRVHRADGTDSTLADVIVDAVRAGASLPDAAASAGISRQTLEHWKLAGGRARIAAATRALNRHEQAYVQFLDAYESARAQAETVRLELIARAGEGGFKATDTTEKYQRGDDGQLVLVERTVVTKTSLPQWQADAWLLERRMPHKYARRVAVAGMDADGNVVPLAERARDLCDDLDAFLAGAATAAEVHEDA